MKFSSDEVFAAGGGVVVARPAVCPRRLSPHIPFVLPCRGLSPLMRMRCIASLPPAPAPPPSARGGSRARNQPVGTRRAAYNRPFFIVLSSIHSFFSLYFSFSGAVSVLFTAFLPFFWRAQKNQKAEGAAESAGRGLYRSAAATAELAALKHRRRLPPLRWPPSRFPQCARHPGER